MNQSRTESRFSNKLNSFLWFLLAILPIILYLCMNFRNPSATDFFAYLAQFSPVNSVVENFDNILNMAISVEFPIINYVAYLFILEFIKVLYHVVVFPFRFCYKLMTSFHVGG